MTDKKEKRNKKFKTKKEKKKDKKKKRYKKKNKNIKTIKIISREKENEKIKMMREKRKLSSRLEDYIQRRIRRKRSRPEKTGWKARSVLLTLLLDLGISLKTNYIGWKHKMDYEWKIECVDSLRVPGLEEIQGLNKGTMKLEQDLSLFLFDNPPPATARWMEKFRVQLEIQTCK